jgi:hypothetical protein
MIELLEHPVRWKLSRFGLPTPQDHATTGKGLPAPRRMMTLVAQVAGAFIESR